MIAEGATAVKLHEGASTTLTVSGSITSSNDSIETTVIDSLIGKLSTGDDLSDVSSALYTFKFDEANNVWVISNITSDGKTVYLNVSDGTNRGYPNTTSEQTLTLTYENGDYFTIKGSNGRYLAFWAEDNAADGIPCFDEGAWESASAGGEYVKFYFYRPAETDEESSTELPGCVKLTSTDDIESGEKYLIVACLNGSYYALYPSTNTSSKADHVIELCYQLEVEGVSSGSTTLTVGGSTYQVIVSAHTWDEGTVTQTATCTEEGVMTYTCSICNKEKTEAIPATGHTAGETVVENEVAATCTTDGSYDNAVYCTVCGAELSRETVIIPATGHSSGSEWQSDESEHWLVCETCGEATDFAQHTYSDWVITKEATDTEDGTRVKTCTVCGHTVTETIPATGSSTDDDTDDSSDTVTAATTDTTSAADSTTAVSAIPADTADTANPALWSLLLLTACVGLAAAKLRSRKADQS
ncbi:MAG: hypothetical protein LUG61_08950 [Lachnospiraceae bacterium]|nr:hypothetical protein [Lachnospiraceae bacterium]